MSIQHGMLERLEELLNRYYRDELASLDTSDRASVTIDFTDLYAYDGDIADALLADPENVIDPLEEAIGMVDLPTGSDLSDASVRVTNLNDEHVYDPGALRKDHGERFVGVRGTLERVTSTSDLPLVAAFECQRCGSQTRIPQSLERGELQEPHECQGCERQGPFVVNHSETEWSDYAKLRIQSRPDADEDADGKLPGYVVDDLIDAGGESGLVGRAGEPVTAYGILRRQQKTGRGANDLLFDHVLDVRGIAFDRDDDVVRVDDHRETFETLAAREDAVDLFADSIAPQLHRTDEWEAAMEFAVAYLFGAPRIDIDDGPTYRGDLHFLIVSDYGMGKSDFKADVEAYSPKCISKSTTALASDVGLTAAAVKDDFGEGAWTIKPGLLVRANGGHLLLDEIDKGPDSLTNMNDALEGEQVVDIEKAGQSATYESRTAVMALGNPVDARFDDHRPTAEQLELSDSLLSRFDGIVTMRDESDADRDRAIASTWGESYTEAQAEQLDADAETGALSRPVPIDVGQAWIKHARENVNPRLTYDQFEVLLDWYADEVRTLNHTFAQDGEGSDMPVPATVRELSAAARMSVAFARAHLREEVADADVRRAMKLGKRLVKQNWNGERFDVTKNVSQSDAMERIERVLRGSDGMTTVEIAEETGLPERDVASKVDTLSQRGDVYSPAGVEGVTWV